MAAESGLHGRRKGRPLSARRTGLMATELAAMSIDLARPAPAALTALFPLAVHELRLEIGFGGGERLIGEAAAHQDIGFIGAEPFLNGLAKAVAAIVDRRLPNIRLHGGDAVLLLDWLPAASIARVDVLYPDPWPKRRHWKRRFISPANLDRLARIMRPGGELRVASDIPAYIDWTLLQVTGRSDFDWTAQTADDWRLPWSGWPGTRYEAKAIAAGRRPAYLTFRRT